jgi:hypothetical protein
MGRQHQQRGAAGENQYREAIVTFCDGLFSKITELLQHR